MFLSRTVLPFLYYLPTYLPTCTPTSTPRPAVRDVDPWMGFLLLDLESLVQRRCIAGPCFSPHAWLATRSHGPRCFVHFFLSCLVMFPSALTLSHAICGSA